MSTILNLATEAYVFANKADVNGAPDFLTAPQLARWETVITDAFHIYHLENTVDGAGKLHIFQCVDAAGAPISLAAGRHAWAVAADQDVNLLRAIRIWKHIQTESWMSWTLTELAGAGGAQAAAVRDSETMRRPTAWDGLGNPSAWDLAFNPTVLGYDHEASYVDTTSAEVSGASAEAW